MGNVIRYKRPAIEKSGNGDYAKLRTHKNKRGKERYEVRIQFLGKRERFYFDSKSEAESFLQEKRDEIKSRSTNYKKGDVEYYTLGHVFREMNQTRLDKEKIRPSTFITNQNRFKCWLMKFENYYTHQIDDSVWDELVKEAKRRKAPSQLEKVKFLLSRINQFALKNNYDPIALDLKECDASYTNGTKTKNSYTMEEYERALSFMDKKDTLKLSEWIGLNTLIFGMNTGLRIGEILSLDYERDIDMINNRLTVRSTYNNTTKLIGDPKTKASFRTIGFNGDARSAILNLREISKELNSNFLVFSKKKRRFKNARDDRSNDLLKEPIGHGVLYGYLRRALIAVGLPVIHSQAAMRKTHITNLILEGERSGISFIEAATVAQQRAGHKKLTTTIDDYTKTSTQKEEKLIGNMSRLNRIKSKEEIDFSKMTHAELVEHIKKIS